VLAFFSFYKFLYCCSFYFFSDDIVSSDTVAGYWLLRPWSYEGCDVWSLASSTFSTRWWPHYFPFQIV
jgi:hypothetical protein